MKLFVTGGSGFLGKHLIKRLLKEGHEVTAFARSESSAEKLAHMGCETVIGDLCRLSSYEEQLAGHDVVIHAASPVKFWGDWSFFQRDIIDVTRELFDAASRQHIKRFIYISSESVLQNDKPLENIDESFPYLEPNSYYGKAKQLAERWLIERKSDMECIVLRPTFIWGPGVSALTTMIEKINNGQFSWLDHGDVVIETVHVNNVVHAIVLALDHGEDKQIYNVTDDQPRSVKEVIGGLLDTQNITIPTKNMSSRLVRYLAGVVEAIWKILRIKSDPPISRFEWSFVGLPRKYNIQKIKQSLGYQPVISVTDGLREMKQGSYLAEEVKEEIKKVVSG